ncbi:MAG TPA: hypothetical protein EYQ50_03230 [Verrucomicrobiales bacterium]|nr:hypothetical protein [Verrucomicrobiales bacterium]
MLFLITIGILCGNPIPVALGKDSPREEDYYRLTVLPIPEGVVLEGGGLQLMPDGKLAVGSRRGEIHMVEHAFSDNPADMKFSLWADQLHEILGLALRGDWLYITHRPGVTKARDVDGDGRADEFLTVNEGWSISGDYHEYAFGSPFDKEGNIWCVLCLTGSFSSDVPYRGWCVRISHDGKLIPTASGIRSPGGIGFNGDGEVFYTDNQGPWNGTSSLKHLTPGSFQGHPAGLKWFDFPEVTKALGERLAEPNDKSRFHIEMERLSAYRPPAVLIPHGKLGNSASGIVYDSSQGKFGPFTGQLFVSDQSFSIVNRIYLEKIKGYYQGAVFEFRKGFGSGNVPMLMTDQGSLFVAGTNRGWGSRGRQPFALERLDWTGEIPFEIHEMQIRPDGFNLTFTHPVDRDSTTDLSAYLLKTYTYIFQETYGSPEVDHSEPKIIAAELAKDGRSLRLRIDGLQIGHVHELHLPGLRSQQNLPLLHSAAYYTLWHLPED